MPPADFSRQVVCILGLPFDVVDMTQAVAKVRAAALHRLPCLLSTPNLNFAVAARSDKSFRDSVNHSQLSLADGMPIVWVSRLLGLPVRERVTGAGLFEAMCQAPGPAVKVFFFGGADGVAQTACERVNLQQRGVHCVGFESPGFASVEAMSSDAHIDRINAADPDFIVVSLGAKKGLEWIERNRSRLHAPVISHLGAVVNFAAGTIDRAPVWLQRLGLEWLWRIKEEPGLWRRYTRDALALSGMLASNVLQLWWHGLLVRSSAGAAVPTVHKTEDGSMLRLTLGGELEAANSAPLRVAFTEAATLCTDVSLDLSAVERVDSVVMALLLLLNAHQRDAGKRLELVGVSKALRRQFRYHGTEFLLSQLEANHLVEIRGPGEIA